MTLGAMNVKTIIPIMMVANARSFILFLLLLRLFRGRQFGIDLSK